MNQIDQEWQNIKTKIFTPAMIDKIESTINLKEVRSYKLNQITYQEWQLPQWLISNLTDQKFKFSKKYLFTGLLQWKVHQEKGMIDKKLVLFSDHHNQACIYQLVRQ